MLVTEVKGRVVKHMMLSMRIRDGPVINERLWVKRANRAKIIW